MRSAFEPQSLQPYDVVRAIISLDTAKADYLTAEQYYDGDITEIFGNSTVARKLESSSRGFKIRFSKIPVDVMLNRTKIASVKASDDDSATEVIEQIRKANQMQIWEDEIHKSVYVYGDAYLLTWAIEPDDMDESSAVREVGVKIGMQSVYNTRAIYDDITQAPAFIVRSVALSDGRRLAQVYYSDAMIQWVTKTESEGHDPSEWVLYSTTEDPGAYLLRYGIFGCPIFHFSNTKGYGRPEHRDAYEPQNAIIKYLAGAVTTIDFQVFKQRYTYSNPKNNLNSGDFGNGWEDEDYAPTDGTYSTNGATASPGSVIDFTGVNGVGEFSTTDSEVFSSGIDKNLEWMGLVTETPLYALNPGGEQPSGKARKIMDEPLVKKVEKRQLLLQTVWAEVYGYSLELISNPTTEVVINWVDASVADDEDVIDVILKKRSLGIPDKALIMELGYTDEMAEDFLSQKSEELSLDYRITKTAEIAETLEKLGGLVTAGLISQDQFNIVSLSLLGEIVPVVAPVQQAPEPAPAPIASDDSLSSFEDVPPIGNEQ